MQRGFCIDLGASFQMSVYLQKLASIPPRTRPPVLVGMALLLTSPTSGFRVCCPGIEIEAPMKVAIYESVADKKRVEVAIMHTGKDKAGHPREKGPNAPLNAPKCNGKSN